MFNKKKKDTSEINEVDVETSEEILFSKEDFENLSKSRKWYFSTPFAIIFAIGVPCSIFAGPYVFLALFFAEIIFIMLLAKKYNSSFDLIKDKMNNANKIYKVSIPKAKKELEDLKSNISEYKEKFLESSERINSLNIELKELEADYLDKMEFMKEYDSRQENYEKLLKQTKDLETKINDLLCEKDNLSDLEEELRKINSKIDVARRELVETNDEILLQSFGLYEPKYDFENSEKYMERLKIIRNKQKDLVRTKEGVSYFDSWTVNGSKREGTKMTNKNIQSAFKLFNSECDIVINKVTYRNIDSSIKRIKKSFEQVNALNETNRVRINYSYLELKLQELYLYFEYLQKKQEEKEEQAAIREQMREEARVQKEIEREKQKIEKEKIHFNKELDRLKNNIPNNPDEKTIWEAKIAELEAKIAELLEAELDVLNREQNTRAGYVYIISNIGSFGENIYKIGVTRRLNPFERIGELSGASVPFKFDVHATIFSEDAPALETALHKAFDDKRVNKINRRKEFFHVTLDEIREEVEKNFNKTVEYTKYAEAMEYRQSLKMMNN